MLTERVYHMPIGLVFTQGHEAVCWSCYRDIVIFTDEGGELLTCDFRHTSPGVEQPPTQSWDKLGRPDGWMELRRHVCVYPVATYSTFDQEG